MDRRALFTLALPMAAAAVASAGSAQAAGPKGGGSSASAYTRYPTLTATVMRPDGRRGVLTVETGLDIQDETLRVRAQQEAPRLRAAYAAVVQRAGAELRPGHAPDIDRLSRELQRATSRLLGRGAVLLLGTVMVV